MVVIYIIYHREIDDSTAENTFVMIIIILARKPWWAGDGGIQFPTTYRYLDNMYIILDNCTRCSRLFLLFPSISEIYVNAVPNRNAINIFISHRLYDLE